MAREKSDAMIVAERLGIDRGNFEGLKRRLEKRSRAFFEDREKQFGPNRMYISGTYGDKHSTPTDDDEVIVYVEFAGDESPDHPTIVPGAFHDAGAREIDGALRTSCNVAFFYDPDIDAQMDVDGVRPITEAATAAAGLSEYEFRDVTEADMSATVFDVRTCWFVPVEELVDTENAEIG